MSGWKGREELPRGVTRSSLPIRRPERGQVMLCGCHGVCVAPRGQLRSVLIRSSPQHKKYVRKDTRCCAGRHPPDLYESSDKMTPQKAGKRVKHRKQIRHTEKSVSVYTWWTNHGRHADESMQNQILQGNSARRGKSYFKPRWLAPIRGPYRYVFIVMWPRYGPNPVDGLPVVYEFSEETSPGNIITTSIVS